MTNAKFFIFFYSIILVGWFIYSFTQVDLNLTLSSNLAYQSIQQQLTYLGYFNRPVSGIIFVALISALFILWWWFLYLIKNKKVTVAQFWLVIGVTTGILFLSYPAFSHDFFNYLFDARIIVKYGQNPYIHKALDFPDDLWVRFMRWTHRTYPYGPVWLVATVPIYALGMGKFVMTTVLYKLLFAIVYVGNTFFIYRVLRSLKSSNAFWAAAFFALNPLVIIESLVSPHLDSLMLLFLLIGLYVFLQGKKLQGVLWIILSAGVKFITGALLPLFLFPKLRKSPRILINWSAWLFLAALMIPIYQREPYPWYFIPFIGLVALSESRLLKALAIGISVGTLLRYAPFLYFGDYGKLVKQLQLSFFIGGIIIGLLLMYFKNKGGFHGNGRS